MPQSLSLVIVHLVFSTKDREPWLTPAIRPRLHAYLAEVARGHGCMAYRVGGVSDHVHLALSLPRTLTQSDLVKELKTTSNHWLEKQDKAFTAFAWQRGYGLFSIGKSQLPALVRYIDDQETHHRTHPSRTNTEPCSPNTASPTTKRTCGIDPVRSGPTRPDPFACERPPPECEFNPVLAASDHPQAPTARSIIAWGFNPRSRRGKAAKRCKRVSCAVDSPRSPTRPASTPSR